MTMPTAVRRLTLMMVAATEESGRRVRAVLMVLSDGAAKDLEPIWFEEGENIGVADAFVVDLMLNANGQTFESLRDCAEAIDLDGVPVKTLSLEGLLLTKQTMRDKDVADRIIIEGALAVFKARSGSST